MHNIAEAFNSESNAEFIRFLRYAKRSCTEVQCELYMAMDQQYITEAEFQNVYEHVGRTRAAIRGFINYQTNYEKSRSTLNPDTAFNFRHSFESVPFYSSAFNRDGFLLSDCTLF